MAGHTIKKIGVVGPGLMGSNMVLDFARHGYQTWMIGTDTKVVEQGTNYIKSSIEVLIEKQVIAPELVDNIWQHIHTIAKIEEIPHDIDLVVETVFEDLELKQQILVKLEKLCSNETILLSNTSSFPPSSLATVLKHAKRFLNAHYFNPSHIVPLVELTGCSLTSPEVIRRVFDFYSDLGKKPVIVHKEITGFIANRLQFALLREAFNIVDEGVASAREVDEAVKASFIPRVAVAGIFQVFDMAGWDLMAQVWRQIVPTLSNDSAIPKNFQQKLDSGELGVKTGRGFYDWDDKLVKEVKSKIIQSLLESQANL